MIIAVISLTNVEFLKDENDSLHRLIWAGLAFRWIRSSFNMQNMI